MRAHTEPIQAKVDVPDGDFEQIYRSERQALLEIRVPKMLIYGGIPVWLGFGLLDAWVAPPEHLAKFLAIRIVGGVIGLVLLLSSRTLLGRRLILYSTIASGSAAGFGVSLMSAYLGGFSSHYYVGLMLIIVGIGIFMPWSLAAFLAYACPQAVGYLLINALLTGLTSNAAMPLFFLVGTILMQAAATYFGEATRRQDLRQRLEIKQTAEQLKQLDRAKNRFFANVSHELRTPLTLIIGSLRAVLRGAPDSQATATAGLRNAAQLLGLVNDLLDLAKLEKTESVRKQPTDVAALTRQITASFAPSGSSLGIELSGADSPLVAEVDPKLYTKAIYNLLSNALKFSRAQGRRIRVRVTRDEESFSASVEDNGIGIPEDKLDTIFERFAQVEDGATRAMEGTGIGLALVKEATTAHGGIVSVQSELGHGTTFTLRFPLGRPQAERTDTVKQAVAEESAAGVLQVQQLAREADRLERSTPLGEVIDEAAPREAPLVLVAEDNKDLRAYLRRVLEPHFRLIVVEDGLIALQQLEARSVDLLLTDQMMPRMDGQQLLLAVRRSDQLRSLPVVFLTADVAPKSRIDALHAGADDYVAKPFDERELVVRIGNLIRAHSQERALAQANVALQEMALLDGLTQVANRRCLDQTLPRLWRETQTQGAPVTMLLCDIDYFKPFNDLYGHQGGDQCLKQVARALRGAIHRKDDLVARYGGEEFAVLLPHTDLTAGTRVADRVLAAIRARRIEHGASAVANIVTVSIGAASSASSPEVDTPQRLLQFADEALYRAKAEGRNRVVCSDSSR